MGKKKKKNSTKAKEMLINALVELTIGLLLIIIDKLLS